MTRPIQIVTRYDDTLIALCASGALFGQVRGNWEPIPSPEDGGRIVSIAVRPNGSLVAVTATGRIFEHYRSGAQIGDYSASWRPVPALPETWEKQK